MCLKKKKRINQIKNEIERLNKFLDSGSSSRQEELTEKQIKELEDELRRLNDNG